MYKYVYKITQKFSDGEIDDQNVWLTASSESEAKSEILSDYHGVIDMVLIERSKI